MNQAEFEIEAESADNPAILGIIADQEAGRFSYCHFSEFKKKQRQTLTPPIKPNQPICFEDNPLKQKVFAQVWQRLKAQYQNDLRTYEALKKEQDTLRNYPSDLVGYGCYIQEHFSFLLPFLFRRHLIPVKESHRQKHTYITGASGSGKSEALKSFFWHYLTANTHTGLVLIDPHGTLSEQVAHFKPNAENGRLIYIDPAIDHEHFPCLNPFDIEGKESMSDIQAENYAEEFRIVFEELLKSDFTEQMNTILIYTLPVMMKYPNASIYDLLQFLEVKNEKEAVEDNKITDYIAFAQKHFKNRSLLEFLAGQYQTDQSYKQTRKSLQTRLRAIFSSTILQAVFTGKKTFDLSQAMDARKLIVFNLSKGKMPREWSIIGKFIIASLKIIALQREKLPEHHRISCHVFIDECQNFVTSSIEEILKEARKYMLHLTLAQQIAGDNMSENLLDAILANTAIKLTGANAQKTLKIIARETGASMESLEKLSVGKFSLYKRPDIGETKDFVTIVTMPTNTLGHKQSMNALQWQKLQKQQIADYYRSMTTSPTENKPTNSVLDLDLSHYTH